MTYTKAKREAQRIATAMHGDVHVIYNCEYLYHDWLGDGVQAKEMQTASISSNWRIVATCHPA